MCSIAARAAAKPDVCAVRDPYAPIGCSSKIHAFQAGAPRVDNPEAGRMVQRILRHCIAPAENPYKDGTARNPHGPAKLIQRRVSQLRVALPEDVLVCESAKIQPQENLSGRGAVIPFARGPRAREDFTSFDTGDHVPVAVEIVQNVLLLETQVDDCRGSAWDAGQRVRQLFVDAREKAGGNGRGDRDNDRVRFLSAARGKLHAPGFGVPGDCPRRGCGKQSDPAQRARKTARQAQPFRCQT